MKLLVRIFLIQFIFTGLAYGICTKGHKSHIRSGPGTSFSLIKSVPRYTPLIEVGSEGEWLRIKGKDFKGWIYNKLISEKFECVSFKDPKFIDCPSHDPDPNRKLYRNEGFKVLDIEIGCNYVEDIHGKRYWVSTSNAWPDSAKELIQI